VLALALGALVTRSCESTGDYLRPNGFQAKFFVAEEWRAQNVVDSLRAGLISSVDMERVGAVWIEYRDQSQSG
jgi:hypothetical protein